MSDQIQILYNKYTITKTDGTPVDPAAQYFVLRVDTDPAARVALKTYAHEQDDPALRELLLQWIAANETPASTGQSGSMTISTPAPARIAIIEVMFPNGVNVRESAFYGAKIIGWADYAKRLNVWDVRPDEKGEPFSWYRVRVNDRDGWVRWDNVRRVGDWSAFGLSEQPLPTSAVVTWGRWDAPVQYTRIMNTFTPQHKGIDYAANLGTPVFCGPMGGKVIKVGRCRACGPEGISSLSQGYALNDARVWGNPEWEGGFGHNVVMEYANAILPNDAKAFLKSKGWEGYNAYVLYGHLKTITVEAGQELTVKTQIGTAGTSGNSDGVHVHSELKFGKDFRHGFSGLERWLANPEVMFAY